MRSDLLRNLYEGYGQIKSDLDELLKVHELDLGAIRSCLKDIMGGPGYGAVMRGDDPAPPYTDWIATHAKMILEDCGPNIGSNYSTFGNWENEMPREFLGVWDGKTTLRTLLEKAKRFCEKAMQQLSSEEPKTVVIVANKWDDALFRKNYETAFLRFALEQNVMFVFFLVTDYGMTRVPFLVKNQKELNRLCRYGFEIEDAAPLSKPSPAEATIFLTDYSSCTLDWYGGTWQHQDQKCYEFNFEKRICYITTLIEGSQQRKIPAKAVKAFALALWQLRDVPGRDDQRKALDAPRYTANVIGKQFSWHCVGGFDDPIIETVANAFEQLIDALR